MSLLDVLSFLAASAATVLGLIGGVMARSLTPDSAGAVREIVQTLEPFIDGQKRLLEMLRAQVQASGTTPATWTSAQLVALQIAEESAVAAHQRISAWTALDTSAESTKAGMARLLIVLGASSAALAAALQLIAAACRTAV